MLQTQVGAYHGGQSVFLRPETAQGVFAVTPDVLRALRPSLPFGVAQIGKAFRNEANPGHFLFRMREFEQADLEYYCAPQDAAKYVVS